MTTGRGGRAVLRALDVIVPLAVLGALLQITYAAGGYAGEVAAALVFVLVTQILPGAVLWRLLRRGDGAWAEDLALGGGLALVVSGVLGALGGRLGLPWLPLLLVATVVIALLVPPVRHTWQQAPTTALPPPGWVAAVAVTGAAFLTAYADHALDNPILRGGWVRHFVDGPYHLALAGEVVNHGPEQFPWVAGTPLRYPWLLYGWDASFAHLPGLPLDVVVFRATPVILLTLLPFVIAAAAWRLSGRSWAGPVGAYVALAAGSLGVGADPATSPVVLNSPPQQLGLILLTCTVALLALRWRTLARRGSWVALLVLLVGLFLAKGGPFPVVLAGMALAAAMWLMLSRTRVLLVVALDLVLAVVVLGVGLVVVLGGSASDLAPDPLAGVLRILTGDRSSSVAAATLAAAAAAFALTRTAGTAAALVLLERERRTDLVRWLVLGAPAAGLGAALLLYQSGMSQQYFLVAGVVVGSLGAAWGIAQTWDRDGGRRVVAAAAAAGLIGWTVQYAASRLMTDASGVDELVGRSILSLGLTVLTACAVLAVALVRPGRAWAGDLLRGIAIALTAAAVVSTAPRLIAPERLVVQPAAPGSSSAWSGANVAAADYLRRISEPSDVVMTNRHCNSLPRPDCDRRAFVISAYAQRRVLVEGWAYTPEALVAAAAATPPASPFSGPFWDPPRLELNDRFLSEPGEADARRLWDLGVRWVYVDRVAGRTGDLTPYAIPVFGDDEATVYRMIDPRR